MAGISTTDRAVAELLGDLATSFDIEPAQLHQVSLTDWTQRPYVGGSYLIYRPGQMAGHAPALHRPHYRRLHFAGSDFSSWSNSMEGAVRSGHAAAAAVQGT